MEGTTTSPSSSTPRVGVNPKKRTNTIAEFSPLASANNKKQPISNISSDSETSFYGFANETKTSAPSLNDALNMRLSNIETKFTELEITINESTTGIRQSLEALENKIDIELRAKTNNTEMEIMIKDIETKLKIHERDTKQQMEKLGNTINGLSEFKIPVITQQVEKPVSNFNPFRTHVTVPEREGGESSVNMENFSAQPNQRTENNLTIEDMEERERINAKKLNLVIHNFIETGSDDDDLSKVKRMITECLGIATNIKESVRIGTYTNGKTRTLLLKFHSLYDKRQVLSRAVTLRRFESTQNVYIKPDLTFQQITQSKNLVEQLKTKRLEEPTIDWTIRRGIIIQRQSV